MVDQFSLPPRNISATAQAQQLLNRKISGRRIDLGQRSQEVQNEFNRLVGIAGNRRALARGVQRFKGGRNVDILELEQQEGQSLPFENLGDFRAGLSESFNVAPARDVASQREFLRATDIGRELNRQGARGNVPLTRAELNRLNQQETTSQQIVDPTLKFFAQQFEKGGRLEGFQKSKQERITEPIQRFSRFVREKIDPSERRRRLEFDKDVKRLEREAKLLDRDLENFNKQFGNKELSDKQFEIAQKRAEDLDFRIQTIREGERNVLGQQVLDIPEFTVKGFLLERVKNLATFPSDTVAGLTTPIQTTVNLNRATEVGNLAQGDPIETIGFITDVAITGGVIKTAPKLTKTGFNKVKPQLNNIINLEKQLLKSKKGQTQLLVRKKKKKKSLSQNRFNEILDELEDQFKNDPAKFQQNINQIKRDIEKTKAQAKTPQQLQKVNQAVQILERQLASRGIVRVRPRTAQAVTSQVARPRFSGVPASTLAGRGIEREFAPTTTSLTTAQRNALRVQQAQLRNQARVQLAKVPLSERQRFLQTEQGRQLFNLAFRQQQTPSTSLASRSAQQSRFNQLNLQQQQFRQLLNQQQRFRQSQLFRQLTTQQKAQALRSQLRQRQRFKQRLTPRKRFRPFIPRVPDSKEKPKTKRIPKPFSKGKTKFDVFSFVKGKPKRINPKPFRKESQARDFGAFSIDRSVKASFFTKPTKRSGITKKIPLEISGFFKRNSKELRPSRNPKRKNVFVEKRKFRIDSGGEKKELSRAKRIAEPKLKSSKMIKKKRK